MSKDGRVPLFPSKLSFWKTFRQFFHLLQSKVTHKITLVTTINMSRTLNRGCKNHFVGGEHLNERQNLNCFYKDQNKNKRKQIKTHFFGVISCSDCYSKWRKNEKPLTEINWILIWNLGVYMKIYMFNQNPIGTIACNCKEKALKISNLSFTSILP